MASTVTTLAEAVLTELGTDAFGDLSDPNSITVDGVIDIRAIVRAVLAALKLCPPVALDAVATVTSMHVPTNVDPHEIAIEAWQAGLNAILSEGDT